MAAYSASGWVGTVAQAASGSHVTAWTGLSNIVSSTAAALAYVAGGGTIDETYLQTLPNASIAVGAGAGIKFGQRILCSNFGFSLPPSAIPRSCYMTIVRRSAVSAAGNYSYVDDYDSTTNAALIKGGVVQPTGSTFYYVPDTTWMPSLSGGVFGDLDVTGFTPADINSSSFGVRFTGYTCSDAGKLANALYLLMVGITIDYDVPGYPYQVNGVPPASIASINGIPTANVGKLLGV